MHARSARTARRRASSARRCARQKIARRPQKRAGCPQLSAASSAPPTHGGTLADSLPSSTRRTAHLTRRLALLAPPPSPSLRLRLRHRPAQKVVQRRLRVAREGDGQGEALPRLHPLDMVRVLVSRREEHLLRTHPLPARRHYFLLLGCPGERRTSLPGRGTTLSSGLRVGRRHRVMPRSSGELREAARGCAASPTARPRRPAGRLFTPAEL